MPVDAGRWTGATSPRAVAASAALVLAAVLPCAGVPPPQDWTAVAGVVLLVSAVVPVVLGAWDTWRTSW